MAAIHRGSRILENKTIQAKNVYLPCHPTFNCILKLSMAAKACNPRTWICCQQGRSRVALCLPSTSLQRPPFADRILLDGRRRWRPAWRLLCSLSLIEEVTFANALPQASLPQASLPLAFSYAQLWRLGEHAGGSQKSEYFSSLPLWCGPHLG